MSSIELAENAILKMGDIPTTTNHTT